MNYVFTGTLIILLTFLAFCMKPGPHTSLKNNQKDIIIPLPKPKVGIDNEEWEKIK